MRVYRVPAFGPENLELVELPDPPLGPGQVRLEMSAFSLNYRDLLMMRGQYDPRLPLPYVPLSDGVGRVLELGPGVGGLSLGQRVLTTFSPSWEAGEPDREAVRATRGGPVPGVLAERVVVEARGLQPVPDGIPDVAAATLPCAGLTAWSALYTLGGLRPGQWVLTLGTGGVSVFALQLARLGGARVIATTGRPERAERLRELGAEEVIDYRAEPRWGRLARRLSGGGVDLVVEVGGAGTLAQSLDAARPGGTVALIGVLAGHREPLDVLPILMKQLRVQGVFVGHRQGLAALLAAVVAGRLEPVVDRVFAFDEAPEAFRYFAERRHFGKVVIARG